MGEERDKINLGLMKKLVEKVKAKREFSRLPDSIVEKVLKICDGDTKGARAFLRKYFGAFLTNRILKGRGDLIKIHLSSKKRNYNKFYEEIFSEVGIVGSVIDLGCGVNWLSCEGLPKEVDYVGVDAVGQLVDLANNYFKESGYAGKVFHLDLFDVVSVKKILRVAKKPRVVFMFQVIDALEGLDKDFSKKFLSGIMDDCEWIVLTLPMESLSGRRKFVVQRRWMLDFLKDNFLVKKISIMNGEKIIILKNKNN